MKILVIDNFDSFTYNLVHLIQEAGTHEVVVKRNHQITPKEAARFNKILISPGPGIPQEAGVTLSVITNLSPTHCLLGVCLGHQAIAIAFGGTLKNLSTPLHGISSGINILKKDSIFNNCPESFKIGHYHSWVVDQVPDDLEITAVNESGLIMALRHKKYDVRGVQFHPESILTEYGITMIQNWLNS